MGHVERGDETRGIPTQDCLRCSEPDYKIDPLIDGSLSKLEGNVILRSEDRCEGGKCVRRWRSINIKR